MRTPPPASSTGIESRKPSSLWACLSLSCYAYTAMGAATIVWRHITHPQNGGLMTGGIDGIGLLVGLSFWISIPLAWLFTLVSWIRAERGGLAQIIAFISAAFVYFSVRGLHWTLPFVCFAIPAVWIGLAIRRREEVKLKELPLAFWYVATFGVVGLAILPRGCLPFPPLSQGIIEFLVVASVLFVAGEKNHLPIQSRKRPAGDLQRRRCRGPKRCLNGAH